MSAKIYKVLLTPRARKDFGRLDGVTARRVGALIDSLSHSPRPAGCKKLTDRGDLWRVKTGDWRVGYLIDDTAREVTILWVGHRRETYKRNK